MPPDPESLEARNSLVMEHAWLVHTKTRCYRWLLPLDDLNQSGFLGLVEAADRFDPEMGVPFTAFARPYIRSRIMDAVKGSDLIRVPPEARGKHRDIRRAILIEEPMDSFASPHRAESVEISARVQQAVSALSPIEQQAVAATLWIGDQPRLFRGVARSLGVSESSLRVAKGRAMAKLRKSLEPKTERSS